MNSKRIAVLSYHTCPLSDEKNAEVGGMNTYVLELSKALSQKGYQIDIYTRSVDTNSPQVVNINPNLRVVHLLAGKPAPVSKKQLIRFIPEFIDNFNKFMKEEKLSYDLINAHYYLSGLIGLQLKKRLNVPLFMTFHTLALMKNLVEKQEDYQRIEYETLLVKNSDKIIATSEADLEYIHTLYGCPLKKISILTPGVDLKVFRPLEKKQAKQAIKASLNHKLILFVGRIVPLKGIDSLLYAMKILTKRNPKLTICLWIIGEESKESKRLILLRNLLKINTFVKFIGKISNQDLPNYYNAAEVLVLPSQYESFGITALEAMACGVPVVITDATGVSNLLDKKHSSLLTSASNPIMLARKINHLLTDNIEHQKMSREVAKKVQDLSWENIADEFIALCKHRIQEI
ncbi:MAG: glycosyltransferase [Candidatus Daviesbacteria bacterium]|nr:glycosyltransferase [Candidatus Daviesbacteria bacterium]